MVTEVDTKACDVCGKPGAVRGGAFSLWYLCERRLLARAAKILRPLLHPVGITCLLLISGWELVQPQWEEWPCWQLRLDSVGERGLLPG